MTHKSHPAIFTTLLIIAHLFTVIGTGFHHHADGLAHDDCPNYHLSPENVLKVTETVAETFSYIDPPNAEFYRSFHSLLYLY